MTERINNAFIFAKKCTLSIKSIALQYKISTNTLPSGEYLWNYNVKDNFYCSRCIESSNDLTVRDNINHSIHGYDDSYRCMRLSRGDTNKKGRSQVL